MQKKIVKISIISSVLFYFMNFQVYVYAKAPDICKWTWLPGCDSWDDRGVVEWFVSNTIAELIKYVAVVAVISLMISGIMYLVSGSEEEKVNKAKKWIIWSLVWVFLSISAWSIISILNNINIFWWWSSNYSTPSYGWTIIKKVSDWTYEVELDSWGTNIIWVWDDWHFSWERVDVEKEGSKYNIY